MLRSISLLFLAGAACADGTVTDNIRVSSHLLGYDLQYRVYLPERHGDLAGLPTLYITDGQNYLKEGRMPSLLDRMISRREIEPVVAIFVDARDPDNPGNNRRNSQFFCNRNYLDFYIDELIPEIERRYNVAAHRDSRTILGLSFGGLNAACFGILGYDTFSGLGMQSPANHAVPNLVAAYEQMPLLPLRIFLSTGRIDDNTSDNRSFHRVLRNKGYPMEYVEVNASHNWDNWRPLLDDILRYFYPPGE